MSSLRRLLLWWFVPSVSVWAAALAFDLVTSPKEGYLPTTVCVHWNPVIVGGLFLANGITALVYLDLSRRMATVGRGLWDILAGSMLPVRTIGAFMLFIMFCGVAHAAYALNVWIAVPWLLLATATPMTSVSVWAWREWRRNESIVRDLLLSFARARQIVKGESKDVWHR